MTIIRDGKGKRGEKGRRDTKIGDVEHTHHVLLLNGHLSESCRAQFRAVVFPRRTIFEPEFLDPPM